MCPPAGPPPRARPLHCVCAPNKPIFTTEIVCVCTGRVLRGRPHPCGWAAPCLLLLRCLWLEQRDTPSCPPCTCRQQPLPTVYPPPFPPPSHFPASNHAKSHEHAGGAAAGARRRRTRVPRGPELQPANAPRAQCLAATRWPPERTGSELLVHRGGLQSLVCGWGRVGAAC